MACKQKPIIWLIICVFSTISRCHVRMLKIFWFITRIRKTPRKKIKNKLQNAQNLIFSFSIQGITIGLKLSSFFRRAGNRIHSSNMAGSMAGLQLQHSMCSGGNEYYVNLFCFWLEFTNEWAKPRSLISWENKISLPKEGCRNTKKNGHTHDQKITKNKTETETDIDMPFVRWV